MFFYYSSYYCSCFGVVAFTMDSLIFTFILLIMFSTLPGSQLEEEYGVVSHEESEKDHLSFNNSLLFFFLLQYDNFGFFSPFFSLFFSLILLCFSFVFFSSFSVYFSLSFSALSDFVSKTKFAEDGHPYFNDRFESETNENGVKRREAEKESLLSHSFSQDCSVEDATLYRHVLSRTGVEASEAADREDDGSLRAAIGGLHMRNITLITSAMWSR